MSDALATALSRLAALDAEVASLKKGAAPAQFDPRAFLQDPVGFMSKMGVPIDHITKVLVAHAMGDQAPAELRTLAAQGPMMSAQAALDAKVEALSRQLSDLTAPKKPTVESVQALITDKSKYPSLSTAAAADPELLAEALAAHGGTAEELATKLESRFSKLMGTRTPPASDANADDSGQSKQAKPAGDVTGGGVPSITKAPEGSFTPDDHKRLRDEIVRKHASQTAE